MNKRRLHGADEISDRTYAHLGHHPATMHLHRLFRNAELAGDLLVEPAGNHASQNLALLRRQARQTFGDRRELRALLAIVAVAFDSPTHGVDEVGFLYRLGQKVDRTGLHGPHAGWNVASAGDENRGSHLPAARERAQEIQAVMRTETHIE